MITRIAGVLESIEGVEAVVAPAGASVAYEVLLPAFLAVELTPRIGATVTLQTLQYLEGQGQGASFVPRLIGFADGRQRAFFELLTTVSGIGNRKALRSMAHPPAIIARAIAEKDARTLATLPEIGKRMAERVIAELDGKVDAFVGGEALAGAAPAGGAFEAKPMARARLDAVSEDAVAALVALGQTRGEAEEQVSRAMSRAKASGKGLANAEAVVAAVFGA
jgi:Holliday junction DNA helicase RuvA